MCFSPVTSATWRVAPDARSPSRRLRTMAALARMFSASLSCRQPGCDENGVGSHIGQRRRRTRRVLQVCGHGLHAGWAAGGERGRGTIHPSSTRRAAVAPPTTPLAPTTSAVLAMPVSNQASEDELSLSLSCRHTLQADLLKSTLSSHGSSLPPIEGNYEHRHQTTSSDHNILDRNGNDRSNVDVAEP